MSHYHHNLITQSSIFLPRPHNFTTSFLNTPSRANSSKTLGFRVSSYHKKADKERIRGENIRLVTKIAEIMQKPSQLDNNLNIVSLQKHENPEKKRQIQLENQRLGKSIMRIKLGKTINSRLKTEVSPEDSSKRKRKRNRKVKISEEYNLFKMQGQIEHYQGVNPHRLVELTSHEPPKLAPIILKQ